MLFHLKLYPLRALFACLILTLLALTVRHFLPSPLPIRLTIHDVKIGALAVCVVILSDGLFHGLFWLTIGDWYRERHREFCETFRGQSLLAMLAGSLMAGVGEELIFRSLSLEWGFLIPSAIVFGLAHHLSRRLWFFTVWATWQGMLFAIALRVTGSLGVTMTAHFLHDLLGFLLIAFLLRRSDTG